MTPLQTVPLSHFADARYGMRIQYVMGGRWHTDRYLKTGEQLALLPLEFDSSTHDVVVIPKRPALPD